MRARSTSCRWTAPSSSARASATRRQCCSSAKRWGAPRGEGPAIDIALDPLEGTYDHGQGGSQCPLAVLAIAEQGCLLNAPDVYMDKIAIGPGYRRNHQPRQVADRKCSRLGRREGRRAARDHRLRPRPPASRQYHRGTPCAGLRHHADPGRRCGRRDRSPPTPTRPSTFPWARAARRKACSPPRHCAA